MLLRHGTKKKKKTPHTSPVRYFALTGELWGAYCEHLGGKGPRDIKSALYHSIYLYRYIDCIIAGRNITYPLSSAWLHRLLLCRTNQHCSYQSEHSSHDQRSTRPVDIAYRLRSWYGQWGGCRCPLGRGIRWHRQCPAGSSGPRGILRQLGRWCSPRSSIQWDTGCSCLGLEGQRLCVIIGSGNGLAPARCRYQAITRTNDVLLSNGPLTENFSEFESNCTNSVKEMDLKMLSGK